MIVGKLFCSISHTLTLLLISYCFLFFISSYFVSLPLSHSLSKRSPLCFSPAPSFPLPSLFFLEKFCSARNFLSPTAFFSFFSLDALSKKEISYLPAFSILFLLFLASLPYSAKALSKARGNHRVFTSFPL